MNIKHLSGITGITPTDAARSNSAAPRQSGRPESVDSTGTTEKLTLTSAGRFLSSSSGEPAPVDRERVDALRKAIVSGDYQIDAERVAARLLQQDRELP